jgi:hypothetical protein
MSRLLWASLCLFCLVALATTADAQTIKLAADKNSGHDSVWVKRYAAGVNSWGIVGNHVPGTNGNIWFQSFPGASGSYKMELGAVLEPDGNSKYRVYVAGSKVAEGSYPYSTGSKDCSASTLKVSYLALGTHTVKQGDSIKLWGEAVYPCGTDHGQYTRWFEIRFTKVGGTTPPPTTKPTKILSPKAGSSMAEGSTVTLKGEGDGTLTWSYDANSDGKGEITIGTGASTSFKVPTGVTGQRTLTLYLGASGGKVDQQHKITTSGPAPTADSGVPAPDTGAPAGDTGVPADDAGVEVDSATPPASDGAASSEGGSPHPTADSGSAAGGDGASTGLRGSDGCTMMGAGAANPRVGALLVGFSFIVLGLLLLLLVLRRGEE